MTRELVRWSDPEGLVRASSRKFVCARSTPACLAVVAGSSPGQDPQNMGNQKTPGHRGFLFDLTPPRLRHHRRCHGGPGQTARCHRYEPVPVKSAPAHHEHDASWPVLCAPNICSGHISFYALGKDGALTPLPDVAFVPDKPGTFAEASVMSLSRKVSWALGTDPLRGGRGNPSPFQHRPRRCARPG